MTPSGSMPEGRGDELGVESVHQVGQAGAPRIPWSVVVMRVTMTWGLSVLRDSR